VFPLVDVDVVVVVDNILVVVVMNKMMTSKTKMNRYFESIQCNTAVGKASQDTNRGVTTVGIDVLTCVAVY